MFNVAICDDDKNFIQYVEDIIKELGYAEDVKFFYLHNNAPAILQMLSHKPHLRFFCKYSALFYSIQQNSPIKKKFSIKKCLIFSYFSEKKNTSFGKNRSPEKRCPVCVHYCPLYIRYVSTIVYYVSTIVHYALYAFLSSAFMPSSVF